MSLSEQPSPGDTLVTIAYSRESVPAAEMVCIVRFIAAYVLAAALLQAVPEIVRACRFFPNMAWSVWLDRIWTGAAERELFRFFAAIYVAVALWRLRREGFLALGLLLLLPETTLRFGSSGQLDSWMSTLPSTMILLVLVLFIYSRASTRGVLRPTHSHEVVVPSAGVDIRWFMRIVGIWMMVPAVDRVSGLFLAAQQWTVYRAYFREFYVSHCVSIVLVCVLLAIGLVLASRQSYRVLPLLATLFLVGGIMSDLALPWDVMHNPKFSRMAVPVSFANSAYGLTMAALVLALYLRVRRWAHEPGHGEASS